MGPHVVRPARHVNTAAARDREDIVNSDAAMNAKEQQDDDDDAEIENTVSRRENRTTTVRKSSSQGPATPRTEDVEDEETSGITFDDLLLPKVILRGLNRAGFFRPSPIQLKSIPLARFGCDIIAQAKSGTGKTIVFAVVVLSNLVLSNRQPQALVVAPTREIANQICAVFSKVGRLMREFQCVALIGGISRALDKKRLGRGCHVAIGTPGRVSDLIERDILKIGGVRMLVIDEADQMHEGDFGDVMKWIVSKLPERKQVMAFSATFTETLLENVRKYMRSPQEIRISSSRVKDSTRTENVALRGVAQYRLVSTRVVERDPATAFRAKLGMLVALLGGVPFRQAVVFCNDKTRSAYMAQNLQKRGWPSDFISGSQKQKQRNTVVRQFRSFETRILVTTDLTARGVDFSGVNLVVNLDIPPDPATYLHRIGRAGRFGTKGIAVTLLLRDWEVPNFDALIKKIGVPVPHMPNKIYHARDDRSAGVVASRAESETVYSIGSSSAGDNHSTGSEKCEQERGGLRNDGIPVDVLNDGVVNLSCENVRAVSPSKRGEGEEEAGRETDEGRAMYRLWLTADYTKGG